jgi:hypothetical protein
VARSLDRHPGRSPEGARTHGSAGSPIRPARTAAAALRDRDDRDHPGPGHRRQHGDVLAVECGRAPHASGIRSRAALCDQGHVPSYRKQQPLLGTDVRASSYRGAGRDCPGGYEPGRSRVRPRRPGTRDDPRRAPTRLARLLPRPGRHASARWVLARQDAGRALECDGRGGEPCVLAAAIGRGRHHRPDPDDQWDGLRRRRCRAAGVHRCVARVAGRCLGATPDAGRRQVFAELQHGRRRPQSPVGSAGTCVVARCHRSNPAREGDDGGRRVEHERGAVHQGRPVFDSGSRRRCLR